MDIKNLLDFTNEPLNKIPDTLREFLNNFLVELESEFSVNLKLTNIFIKFNESSIFVKVLLNNEELILDLNSNEVFCSNQDTKIRAIKVIKKILSTDNSDSDDSLDIDDKSSNLNPTSPDNTTVSLEENQQSSWLQIRESKSLNFIKKYKDKLAYSTNI